jgi:hypothetical protein
VQKLPNSRDLKMVLAAQQADMGDADKALKDVRALLKGNELRRPTGLYHAGADEHAAAPLQRC